ncbi:probable racemase [Vibrio variabilis]|uniref:Probable racemase n=1 Tax=Vibrio variabilis TaxID=990271 RepID=A0ABQ0JET0_9VIBR|nr:probable racemase [Vibrio variabilis]
MGAEVIKIERPGVGDLCRNLVINDQKIGDNSLLFHTFNRNKKSVALNLKSESDLEKVKKLISSADVMIHNFRPGVMERIGLDYSVVSQLNPRIIYGSVSGYGDKGPWRDKPGQDLLVQSLSGLALLSGNAEHNPTPVGLPVLDIAASGNLVQGILAAIIRRGITGKGGLVEVDLMSCAFDIQFEQLTAYVNDNKEPSRSKIANANIYGAAPYGIYKTADGYLALAMMPIALLAELLECEALNQFTQDDAFQQRDEIKDIVADAVKQRTTTAWLEVLEARDVWCADVLDWSRLLEEEGFKALEPLQTVEVTGGEPIKTTRCPIRFDGEYITSSKPAPLLGAHTNQIIL